MPASQQEEQRQEQHWESIRGWQPQPCSKPAIEQAEQSCTAACRQKRPPTQGVTTSLPPRKLAASPWHPSSPSSPPLLPRRGGQEVPGVLMGTQAGQAEEHSGDDRL